MRFVLTALLSGLACQALRIIQSNDDGWAELYLRAFNDELRQAGHKVILSAPAENKSGSSSLDIDPSTRSSQCQYASCPRNAGRFGANATRPDLNWVNSYPVTSIRYGIHDFAPALWGPDQPPELAVTGPNVGSNLWLAVPFSGTVGAACYAAHDAAIPAIAFSGASDGTLAWDTTPVPDRARVYAQLAAFVTDVVASSGKPYLPDNVWLNVNFPRVTDECASFDDFKFVLSRINSGLTSPRDVDWCGTTRLPHELSVSNTRGCYVSISPGDAADKTTVDAERQAAVLDKLRHILTCLPE